MGDVTFEEKLSGELDALYAGALLLAEHAERAETVVLEVVRAAAGLPSPEAPAFRPWILRRLVRHVLDEAEAAREPAPPPASASAADGDRVPALDDLLRDLARFEASDEGGLGDLLRATMRELPIRDRAALWLVNVMGLEYGEAAAALRTGREEVRNRLYRARRELQARVAVALRQRLREGGSGTPEGRDGGQAAGGGSGGSRG